jgi:LEA14-like dessication related protein
MKRSTAPSRFNRKLLQRRMTDTRDDTILAAARRAPPFTQPPGVPSMPSSSLRLPAAAFAVALLLAACASLTRDWLPPEVQLRSIQPERISLSEQRLKLGLDLKNPNDRMLPIKAMTYKLALEGTQVATGGGALDKQIPAFGAAPVEVEVVADAASALGLLPALALKREPIGYRISGTVTVAGVVPIPYRYSGEVDPQVLLRAAAGGLR